MIIRSAVRTDIGKVRKKNEDSLGCCSELTFYIVADGMGGHQGGAVASALAVESMRRSLQSTQAEDLTPIADSSGHYSSGGRRLEMAVHQANNDVFERSKQDAALEGMGTTVAAILFDLQEKVVCIGHVGDSRVYRVRDGQIDQLTEDHSVVQQLFRHGEIDQEEMRKHPSRHMLTQALGTSAMVRPDIRIETPQAGDMFVLCSDGVHGVINDQELLERVTAEGQDLQNGCDGLVDLANERGGPDNSTVIVLAYEETAAQ